MSQKSSFSVSRLLDVLGAGKTAEEKRTEGVDIAVVVDDGAPRENVLVVRDAFVAEQPNATVRVLSYADAPSDATNRRDAVLYLVGSNPRGVGELALSRARAGVPVALVAQSALELPAIGDLPEEVGALVSEIVVSDESRLADRLARWLIDATDKPIAMAANFPFCRPVLVNSLAARCAAQNAAVGAVDVIHGSDFPIMAANQAKLALDIAAAYGDALSPQTALDVALVLAAGVSWRAFARLVDGILPVGNWVSRAVFAFAGTIGTSRLIVAAHDGTLAQAVDKAREVISADSAQMVQREAFNLPVAEQPASKTGYISY